MEKKILYIVNDLKFFISHRLPIALAALKSGFEVHIACPEEKLEIFQSTDIVLHTIRLERGGLNVFKELGTLMDLIRIMRKLRPDVVHAITPKANIYGGISARLSNVKSIVVAVSGLGFVFANDSFKAKLLQKLVIALYKTAFNHRNIEIIFQNRDDLALFEKYNVVDAANATVIPGSGVDLEQFRYIPEPVGIPRVLFGARLLKDKGIFEYINAVRLLKARNVSATFVVSGSRDAGNPASVTETELNDWKSENIAEFLGFRADMSAQIAASNIVVLPSYREGFPKGLIEAASCGRAVITCDVPGCRDAIIPGVSGLLVQPRQSKDLADAMQILIEDFSLRESMGLVGRLLAEQRYSIVDVVATHLKIYQKLMDRHNQSFGT